MILFYYMLRLDKFSILISLFFVVVFFFSEKGIPGNVEGSINPDGSF